MHRKIDFLIIGAPKSGTTSLYDYLGQHPDIFLPHVKENRYFVQDDLYQHGETFLDPLYRSLQNEEVIGGAHVQLMYFPYAATRVYNYNPKIKLIAVLRNPIDRAYSDYWYARRNGWESCKTFEEALEDESERCNGTLLEQALTYLRHGHYCEQLERYLAIFNRANVFVTPTEDLSCCADETLHNILVWLGVDPARAYIDVTRRSNEAGMPRSIWLQRMLMSHDAWYKRFAKKITTLEMRYVLNRLIEKSLNKNIKSFVYPPMPESTRVRLVEYFIPHNEKLSKLIGRDLSHWR